MTFRYYLIDIFLRFGIIAEENKFRAFVSQLIEHDPDLRVNARCISAD